jgi:hypothetical protein
MGDLSVLRAALGDRIGYGDDDITVTSTLRKLDRAINKGQRRICQERFMFLRKRGTLAITKNNILYSLASDFGIEDIFFVTDSINYIASVTTWTLDTSANCTGHFNSAVDTDYVGEDSVVQIGANTFIIQSITGDGTAADSVELDYAAASDTVTFISSDTDQGKNQVQLQKCSFADIFYYPATGTKDCPACFCVEGYDSTGSLRTVYIGNPTSDDNYLCEYWYFPFLADLSAATDTSIISTIYKDDPIVAFAAHYYYKEIKEPELAADALQDALRELAAMKREHAVRQIMSLRA